MAGLLVGASSSALEALYAKSRLSKQDAVLSSFEKELEFILDSIRKRDKVPAKNEMESIQKLSNSLFYLWNKYQTKLPDDYIIDKILGVADDLYQQRFYGLARVHGYRRCLLARGVQTEMIAGDGGRVEEEEEGILLSLYQCVSTCESEPSIVAMLRSEIGDAMCQYFVAEENDCRLLHHSTRAAVLSTLSRLQTVSQLALAREDRYWLAHNAFSLTYRLCRKMMSAGHVLHIVEYLLWCAVGMETSVPLVSVNYLPIRTNCYIAVCECYYHIQHPAEAEVFARRALDKIQELAKIYYQTNTNAKTDYTFRTATIKLGIMIFKRTVFESRKKSKFPFRSRARPSTKDFLLLPSPRSPTEKLLQEMFPGESAQFMAILETLTATSWRALQPGIPPPISDLDCDLLWDIYQELFCMGVDISARALYDIYTHETPTPLIESAIEGDNHIPLKDVVTFVLLAQTYQQKEVAEILTDKLIQFTIASPMEEVQCRGILLQLRVCVESLMIAHKKCVCNMSVPPRKGRLGEQGSVVVTDDSIFSKTSRISVGVGLTSVGTSADEGLVPSAPCSSYLISDDAKQTSPEEVFELLEYATHLLHSALQSSDILLTYMDFFLDSLLVCWEVSCPIFSRITNHDYHSCKAFLHHRTGPRSMELLAQLVSICHKLELWRVDPLLHGDLMLKLCCLYEARAERKDQIRPIAPLPEVAMFLFYTRSHLLQCKEECERALDCIKKSRKSAALSGAFDGLSGVFNKKDGVTGKKGGGGEMEKEKEVVKDGGSGSKMVLEDLHAEFVYVLMRVQVKLATTIPHPPVYEEKEKVSSLMSRVRERKEQQADWDHLISKLTCPTVKVVDLSRLRAGCGRNKYKLALLSMLEATICFGLDQEGKETKMEEGYHYLQQHQQTLSNFSHSCVTHGALSFPCSSSSSHLLPPPLLVHCMETTMEFSPQPLHRSSDTSPKTTVAYYKLFGRVAAGSNVKVRTNDKHYPGLGMEVSAEAGCRLRVSGLQPDEEYVFALASYTKDGHLIGDAIGLTSHPFLASYSLPILIAWGYCCQCGFSAGAGDVTRKASKILWDYFLSKHHSTVTATATQASKKGAHMGTSRGCDGRDHTLPHFRLDKVATSLSSASHLKHFIYSILAITNLSIKEGGLLADLLSLRHKFVSDNNGGSLRANHLRRLGLVQKLLVALEVAGILNEGSLCLQVVVQMCGLLAPLLQHKLSSRPLLRVLLHCHSVLIEIPESFLLQSRDVTSVLHHFIAVTMYQVGKMLLSKGKKSLFSLFTSNAKSLVLLTMHAALDVESCNYMEANEIDLPQNLDISAFFCVTHDTIVNNFDTMTSIPVTTFPQKKISVPKKKKKHKKVQLMADDIPDECKTVQYKSIEAFLASHQHLTTNEDFDLTGVESPVILHSVIASQSPALAYKEVSKFRRRPQYLEMIVHLISTTVARGHVDKAIDWLLDTFQWIAKRNEIVLSNRGHVPTIQGHGFQARSKQGGYVGGRRMTNVFTAHPYKLDLTPSIELKKCQSVSESTSQLEMVGFSSKKRKSLATEVAGRRMSLCTTTLTMKPSYQGITHKLALRKAQLLSPQAAELSQDVVITRDDLDVKTASVLMTQFFEAWHTHKCRMKLRAACIAELPWRAQANLLLSNCYLHQVLGKLKAECGIDEEERVKHGVERVKGGEERVKEGEVKVKEGEKRVKEGEERVGEEEERVKVGVGDHDVRFDSTGVIIKGLIPVFSPSLAGQCSKPTSLVKLHAAVTTNLTVSSSGSFHSDGPILSHSFQLLVIDDVHHCMKYLQQATVLALRGKHWTLLQNVARSLMNTINCLIHVISQFRPDVRDTNVAAVYGLACRPLYMLADGLLDLLAMFHFEQFPLVSSLQFDSCLDGSNQVGLGLVKQVVFLAIHTLYVHQHWEKVLALALRFDNTTKHSWGDQLIPVIQSAQIKLVHRVTLYQQKCSSQEKLEPAAHLDPGPEGHDVYGTVGYSLFLVPKVYLEKDLTKGRSLADRKLRVESEGDRRSECEHELVSCRVLLQRYVAGVKRPELVRDRTLLLEVVTDGGDGTEVELEVLSKLQLHSVVAAYDRMIQKLKSCRERELESQAMNELGDALILSGNVRLAAERWSDGLACLMRTKDPLENRRKLYSTFQDGCGLWGCLLGSWMAVKLMKYVYWKQLDVRLEYALLASSFLKAALTFSSHLPTSDLAYATFEPNPFKGARVKPFPGLDLFSDIFRCSPSHLLATLRWCSHELVSRGHALKALPMVWFYHHVAAIMCRTVRETVRAKILCIRNFLHFPFFGPAIYRVHELLTGSGLPQDATPMSRPPESSLPLPSFQDNLPISDAGNLRVLTLLLDRPMRARLEVLYGQVNVGRLTVAIALLYTALAHTLPPPTPAGYSGWSLAALAQNIDITSDRSRSTFQTITSASSSSTHLDHPQNENTSKITSNIRQDLLRHSEKVLGVSGQHLLGQWCKGQVGVEILEVRVEILLALVQVAIVLQHSKTAYQLSLQALRLLQSVQKKSCKEGRGLLRECDMRLWLESRCWMVRSVVGLLISPGGVEVFCKGGGEGVVGDACNDCVELGEVELRAEVEFHAALHALSLFPCLLAAAQQHSETCVQLLCDLPELSYRASLILSRASLLLADVTCVQGTRPSKLTVRTLSRHSISPITTAAACVATQQGIGEEMISVFDGLAKAITKQLEAVDSSFSSSSSFPNIYLPQRQLLASCLLHRAHTHLLLANREVGKKDSDDKRRHQHLERGMESCKRGLEMLELSAIPDLFLRSELQIAYGWLVARRAREGWLSNCMALLTIAGKTMAAEGTDYRLAYTTFLGLAELYCKSSKQTYPSKKPASSIAVTTSISHASPSATMSLEDPNVQLADTDWERQRKLEAYLAWAMIKTALQVSASQLAFRNLISASHQDNMTKLLNDRALQNLPDFAFLEIDACVDSTSGIDDDILHCLTKNTVVLPVHRLLPRNQFKNTKNLTWIKVLNYYHHLTQRSVWQKTSLQISDSDWGLHYHSATPSLHLKSRIMYMYLSNHCSQFKATCLIPPLPHCSIHHLGQIFKIVGRNHTKSELFLTAGDTDLSLIWHGDPLPLLFHSNVATLPGCEMLTGYFAFNVHTLQCPTQNTLQSLGIEVHVIHTTLAELSELHQTWLDLEENCRVFLQHKDKLVRPVSRSKHKKHLNPPECLMKQMANAVREMAGLFKIKAKELPKLEPHVVQHVTKVLEPFMQLCLKSDSTYHFCKELLSS